MLNAKRTFSSPECNKVNIIIITTTNNINIIFIVAAQSSVGMLFWIVSDIDAAPIPGTAAAQLTIGKRKVSVAEWTSCDQLVRFISHFSASSDIVINRVQQCSCTFKQIDGGFVWKCVPACLLVCCCLLIRRLSLIRQSDGRHWALEEHWKVEEEIGSNNCSSV